MADFKRVPFVYLGNKARHYKLIKKLFEESKAKEYVDPFAGSLFVPLSIKRDYPTTRVMANVYDPRVHRLFDVEDPVAVYMDAVKKIYGDTELIPSRQVYKDKDKDKAHWQRLKSRFATEIKGVQCCPCCGRELVGKGQISADTPESALLRALITLNLDGRSLAGGFYTLESPDLVRDYFHAVQGLDTFTRKPFRELEWGFDDAFVLVDPPYIRTTRLGQGEMIGCGYADRAGGADWLPSDDGALLDWVAEHANGKNIFALFGSEGNNLQQRMRERFKIEELRHLDYAQNTFGHTSMRREWLALTYGRPT